MVSISLERMIMAEKLVPESEVQAMVAAALEKAWKLLRCAHHTDGPKPWCDQCQRMEALQKQIAALAHQKELRG